MSSLRQRLDRAPAPPCQNRCGRGLWKPPAVPAETPTPHFPTQQPSLSPAPPSSSPNQTSANGAYRRFQFSTPRRREVMPPEKSWKIARKSDVAGLRSIHLFRYTRGSADRFYLRYKGGLLFLVLFLFYRVCMGFLVSGSLYVLYSRSTSSRLGFTLAITYSSASNKSSYSLGDMAGARVCARFTCGYGGACSMGTGNGKPGIASANGYGFGNG